MNYLFKQKMEGKIQAFMEGRFYRRPHNLDVLYHLGCFCKFLAHQKCFVSMNSPAFGKAAAGGCRSGDQGMA